MQRWIIQNLPSIFALLLFLAGSTIALFAYAAMAKREDRGESFLNQLAPQAFHQFFQKESCFGEVEVRVKQKPDRTIELISKGAVALSYQGTTYPLSLDGEIHFNSLGQALGCILTLRGNNLQFRLTTIDVNPIKVRFTAKGPNLDFYREMVVPGPLQIFKNSDDTFRLAFEPFGKLSSNWLQKVQQFSPLLPDYRLVTAKQAALECKPAQVVPLDLSMQVAAVEQGLPMLMGVIGK